MKLAARVGGGLGEAVTARGWHGTGVFGRLGAAAAAAVLLRLDGREGVARARRRGNSDRRPYRLVRHDGQTLPRRQGGDGRYSGGGAGSRRVCGATGLFEPGGGLDNALVQDRAVALAPVDFTGWRILDNSFKPYAACHLTHPAIDGARSLSRSIPDLAGICAVRAEVGALADQITGGKSGTPATPLEGKFDLKYCVALGLHGHELSAADFREPWHPDPAICATAGKVRIAVSPEMGFAAARLSLDLADGRQVCNRCAGSQGPPRQPDWLGRYACQIRRARRSLSWRSRRGAVRPGTEFGRPGTLDEMRTIWRGSRSLSE